MTREEAVEKLEVFAPMVVDDTREAIDMAIKALEELPKRRKEAKRWKRKALKEKPIVRCKDCKHRHDLNCPMYYEEWFTIDEGDGWCDSDFHIIDNTDFHIIDNTQDDGFCYRGEGT